MKTAEEITAYLEMELADAYEQHEQAKGMDAQVALHHLIMATTIQALLDGIKADKPKAKEPKEIKPGHLEKMLMKGEITEEEYKKKKAWYVETLMELYFRDIITEEELKERLNK